MTQVWRNSTRGERIKIVSNAILWSWVLYLVISIASGLATGNWLGNPAVYRAPSQPVKVIVVCPDGARHVVTGSATVRCFGGGLTSV